MKNLFLKPNDLRLKKISAKIPQNRINSPDTQKIIKAILRIAFGEQKDQKKPIMVGLAAPQIGILKRIILVDVKASGKGPLRRQPASPNRGESEASKVGDLRIYINPEIIWQSKRSCEWYEGCYSTDRICGIVSRPTSIKIRAFVPQPEKLPHELSSKTRCVASLPHPMWDIIEEKWTGYIARIFQHEIDHLNGKVFINHIKDPNHLHWVEENEFPLYRNKQAWRNWPKKHPFPLA